MTNTLTRENIISEAAALATNEAKGSNAKIELVMSMAQAAQARAVQPSDASDIFDAYLLAKRNTTLDTTTLAGKKKAGADVTEGYAAKTKSEWKQILSCGAHMVADGVEALSLGRDVALSAGLHVYDALVKVARAQIKAQNTLTRAEIEQLLASEQSEKDTSELKRLKDIVKAMEKVRSGTEATEDKPGIEPAPSPQLDAAIEQLNSRIADIAPKTEAAVAALMTAGYTRPAALALLGRRK